MTASAPGNVSLWRRRLVAGLMILSSAAMSLPSAGAGEITTWDGRYPIDRIRVTMVYFVPANREPLPDWKERLSYFAGRIETFHAREFDGQSKLTVHLVEKPLQSKRTTAELRRGDANQIFFRTLRETARRLDFSDEKREVYPILLVLSDINWRPLADFYRVRPTSEGFAFTGKFIDGYHYPGAAAGGARATYLAERGMGWGLVSADGWRVPYRGSDCVVYHEGIGHPIGLPHPQPGDGSVMSLGQYKGWLNESWVKGSQKRRLGWTEPSPGQDRQLPLFSTFRALPRPRVPHPGQAVSLACDWPEEVSLASVAVSVQTELRGPWRTIDAHQGEQPPAKIALGTFEEETPVSYRLQARTTDGRSVELWGYFQVRRDPEEPLIPAPSQVPEEDRQVYQHGEKASEGTS